MIARLGSRTGRRCATGWGWRSHRIPERPAIHHGGGIFGFVSDTRYYPDEDLYVVVLVNTTGNLSPAAIADELVDVLVPPVRIASRPFTEDAAPLVGTYSGPARGRPLTVTVTATDDGIAAAANGGRRRRSRGSRGGRSGSAGSSSPSSATEMPGRQRSCGWTAALATTCCGGSRTEAGALHVYVYVNVLVHVHVAPLRAAYRAAVTLSRLPSRSIGVGWPSPSRESRPSASWRRRRRARPSAADPGTRPQAP